MDDDPDLSMKGDDLPLLMPDDIMWNSNSCDNKNRHSTSCSEGGGSSLAELLSSSVKKSKLKSNDHGGIMIKNKVIEDFYGDKSK